MHRTGRALAAWAFLFGASLAHAEAPRFEDYRIPNPPGVETGSTHELAFSPEGDVWVTQQKQGRLVRIRRSGKITALPLGEPGDGPHGIDIDRGGRLWLSLEFANRIVQADGEGTVLASYPIPVRAGRPAAGPHGLVVARDGSVWWAGKGGGVIGRLNPRSGRHKIYRLPNPASQPIYITQVSDGNLWFTELNNNAIGRITPDGHITEYRLPGTDSRPIVVVEGPDRRVWFTMEAGHGFGTITRDGRQMRTYPANPASAKPAGLAFDRNGRPWLQYMTPDMIARVEPDMSVTPFCIRATCKGPPRAVMHRIDLGPDGLLWFTELGLDRVGKIVSGY
jgi:virginiamycin B lyase